MSNPRHILYFIFPALFWGGSFLAIGVSVQYLPPFFAAFLRSFIAMTAVGFFLLVRGKTLRPHKLWLQSVGSGCFIMGFAWVFLFWGEKYVNPALAAILNSTVPIFTVLLTPLMTPKDKLSWNKWAGVILGFVGVGIIFAPEISWDVSFYLKGLIAILLMSVSYAIGVLWTRRLSTQVENAVNLFYQCLGSAILLLLFSGTFELGSQSFYMSWSAVLALLYLGIFSTAIAWLLFFVLVKEVGSIQATAVTYCMPFVAIFLDAVFLKKWLVWNQAVGACVILGAVFLIHKKRLPLY